MVLWLLFSIGVALVFGWLSLRLRFLTLSGSVAAGVFAFSLLGLGGMRWILPALTFFLTSSLLSKLGRRRKAALEETVEKGSRRDAVQVVANGGVAWVLLLVYTVQPSELLYWMFVASLAAAAADTWATEIGTLSRRSPFHLVQWTRVPPGTSGAVSLTGTLGAVAGAAAVWLSLWLLPEVPAAAGVGWSLVVVVASGVAASFVDSLAGGTLQARYRDVRTGRITERPSSNGSPHVHTGGIRGVDNDAINLFCTASGALIALFVAHLI